MDTHSSSHFSASFVQKVSAHLHKVPRLTEAITRIIQSRPLDTFGRFDSLKPRLPDPPTAQPPYSLSYLHTYWRHSGSYENASGLQSFCTIDFPIVVPPFFFFSFSFRSLLSWVLRFRLWFVHGLIGACQRNCGFSALMFYHLGCHLALLRLFLSSALPLRICTGGLLYPLVHGCFFFGAGWRFQGVKSLLALHTLVATNGSAIAGGLLITFTNVFFFPSSIVAFRCSRVVINGTRWAIRNSLFSIRAVGTKYLSLFYRLFPACASFRANGGSIILGFFFAFFLSFFSVLLLYIERS